MSEPEPPEQRNIVVRALFDKQIAYGCARPALTSWLRWDKPEGLMVVFRVRMESEIVQWLIGWGGNVRVLRPESLRRRLSEGRRIVGIIENFKAADITLSLASCRLAALLVSLNHFL
jgi:predicted DNA-binding transcriptional regulator YafY